MDISQPLPLLGGLSPQLFMKRHWQKKPLLDRAKLFELAGHEDAQARLVVQQPGWQLKLGPFARQEARCLLQDWQQVGWLHQL